MAAADASSQSGLLPRAASVSSQVFRGGGGGIGERAGGQTSLEGKAEMEAERDLFSSQRCTCCPYGYHIDLDFLQYLDSLYNAEKLKTLKRFRRQGSRVLSPDHTSVFTGNQLECSRQTENFVFISDGEGMSPTEVLLSEIELSLLVGGTVNSASIASGQDRTQDGTRDKTQDRTQDKRWDRAHDRRQDRTEVRRQDRTQDRAQDIKQDITQDRTQDVLSKEQSGHNSSEPKTDSRGATSSASLISEVVSANDSWICTKERIEWSKEVGTAVESDESQVTKKTSEVKLSLTSLRGNEPCKSVESSSHSPRLGDVLDADGGGVSSDVLQAIREQMAASLRRMKELEEQVKVIPVLQSRISMLTEENRLLFVSADRTFCDAAVGDVSLEDDLELYRSERTQVALNGENSRIDSSQFYPRHSDSFSMENQSSVGAVELRKHDAMFLCDVETQTAETGVGLEVAMEPGRKTRSDGISCEVSMKDISVGSIATFAESGVGKDEGVAVSDLNILLKHIITETSISEEVSCSQFVDLRSSQIVSARSEISDGSRCKGLEASEVESAGNSGRFRSIGIQCGDGIVSPGNDQMWKLDFPQVSNTPEPFNVDRGTEMDGVSSSEEIAVCVGVMESSAGEEVGKRKLDDVAVNKQMESPGETVTNSLGIIGNSKDVIRDEESGSLEGNSAVEIHIEKLSMEVTCPVPVSSTETLEGGGKGVPSGKGAPGEEDVVECVVSEHTLESPRCGLSVIIDDSSESTSATASDSEDGSTMSVIEVLTHKSGIGCQRAAVVVRSVDDYFPSEESDEALLAGSILKGMEGVAADPFSVGVGSSIVSTGDVFEEKMEEDLWAFEKKEESGDLCKVVLNVEVATAVDSCLLNVEKTVKEEEDDVTGRSVLAKDDLISSVEGDIVVVAPSEHIAVVERLPEQEGEDIETVERESSQTDEYLLSSDDSGSIVVSCPETDHVELMRMEKKHATCVVDVGEVLAESDIPAEETALSPDILRLMQGIPGVFPMGFPALSLASGDLSTVNETRSTATHRRIVITETKIERRRIDHEEDPNERNPLEMPLKVQSDADVSDNISLDVMLLRSEKMLQGEETVKASSVFHSREMTDVRDESDSELVEEVAASPGPFQDRTSEIEVTNTKEEEESNKTAAAAGVNDDEKSGTVAAETVTSILQSSSSSSAEDSRISPPLKKEEKDDGGGVGGGGEGGIGEALSACDQWLLSPDETDINKVATLDLIRKHWFLVSGRKSSSASEVRDFLSLAQTFTTSGRLLATLVNLADADGNTALHYAVSYGNTEVLRLLLDTGTCDVNKQNKAGYSSIMLAALLLVDMDRYQSIIRRLFEIGDVNAPSTLSGQTALMLAASHGRNETVELLMDCGAEVNAQDEDGSTALMCASEHGHVDIIKTLLSHEECDSLLIDVDGSTALSIAMDEGYQEIGVLLYAHMKAARGSIPEEDEDVDQD